MRPLDEEVCRQTRSRLAGFAHPCGQELKAVFEKLHKYIGKSVEQLVNRSDAPHVFRLHKKVRRRLARATRRPQPLTPLAAATLSSCTTCGKT